MLSISRPEQQQQQGDDATGTLIDLAFDVSPFHPQGGGQPSDVGTISIEQTEQTLTYFDGTNVF